MSRLAFLPDETQALLLQACLFEDQAAEAAWRAWRSRVDIDRLDSGSVRLLPVLASRLRSFGHGEDPDTGRYLGMQRRAWVNSQRLFRAGEQALAGLAEAGIRVMGLKGLPLALLYYPRLAERPMSDIDLLVRPQDAVRAAQVLARLGWSGDSRPPSDGIDLAIDKSVSFSCAEPAMAIDLHWRAHLANSNAEAEEALWARAVELRLGKVCAWAPSAADLLLQVCEHGAKFSPVPPHRWVLDAAMICRGGQVDWDHFLVQAQRLELELPLAFTLTYLAEVMRQPIPAHLLQALAGAKPTAGRRALFHLQQTPFERRQLWPQFRLHLHLARQTLGPGLPSYWRYFQRLRAGRGLGRTVGWLADRAARSLRQ